ncbi:hypothetical protein L4F39_00450 [Vibrio paracholerae]|uniref:hypothetical protein n=1 Tax=Vibrio paracholerae TaxID=650003 RepID=UPI0020963A36|nr:hypothetical protein [Vibrio paracholerae]MCO7065195.1 hypothetical protein [Vibrio paracholerae]
MNSDYGMAATIVAVIFSFAVWVLSKGNMMKARKKAVAVYVALFASALIISLLASA